MEVFNQLVDMVKYAKKYIPFYRKLYEDVNPEEWKNIEDFEKLPIISANDLVTHFEELKSTDGNLYRVTSSSGTLGSPKVIYRTKKDTAKSVDVLEELLIMAGVTKEDSVLIGQPFDMAHFGYLVSGGLAKIGALAIPAGIAMSNEKYLSLIKLYKPSVICTSLSRILTVIKLLKEENIESVPWVRTIILAGEPVTESGIEKIKEYFHTVPFNFYGSEETDGLAGDCKYHAGIHFFDDLFHLELLELKGVKPKKEGNRIGEAVLTSLYQKGVPLIRYRLGDIIEVEKGKCQCGSERPLIHVYGRADDAFSLFDGITLRAFQIKMVLDQFFKDIMNYQIVLSTLVPGMDEVLVRIERKSKEDSFNEEEIIHTLWCCSEDLTGLREKGHVKFKLSVDQSDIVVTQRGKTRKIIDLRNEV